MTFNSKAEAIAIFGEKATEEIAKNCFKYELTKHCVRCNSNACPLSPANDINNYRAELKDVIDCVREIEDEYGVHLLDNPYDYDIDLDIIIVLVTDQLLKMENAEGNYIRVPKWDAYSIAMALYKYKTEYPFRKKVNNLYNEWKEVNK